MFFTPKSHQETKKCFRIRDFLYSYLNYEVTSTETTVLDAYLNCVKSFQNGSTVKKHKCKVKAESRRERSVSQIGKWSFQNGTRTSHMEKKKPEGKSIENRKPVVDQSAQNTHCSMAF